MSVPDIHSSRFSPSFWYIVAILIFGGLLVIATLVVLAPKPVSSREPLDCSWGAVCRDPSTYSDSSRTVPYKGYRPSPDEKLEELEQREAELAHRLRKLETERDWIRVD